MRVVALWCSLLLVAACGGDDDGGGGGGDDAGAADGAPDDPDAGPTLARPPQPGAATPPDGEGVTSFAVSRWFLGATDREGQPDADAWERLGYDIDGRASTASSDGLCQVAEGGSAAVAYPDGEDGIDNSFGRNVWPILLGLDEQAEVEANEAVLAGGATLVVSLVELGDGAAYGPLEARGYQSVDLGGPPAFDGTDELEVDPRGLENEVDLESARAAFPDGYLVDDTFVSGPRGELDVLLAIAGHPFRLRLREAVVTMELDRDHTQATGGTISGVVATVDLQDELRALAASIDEQFCSGATIDALVAQVGRASDILQDGTQDPDEPCDAISVGLGFDAAGVIRAGIGDEPPPTVTDCP